MKKSPIGADISASSTRRRRREDEGAATGDEWTSIAVRRGRVVGFASDSRRIRGREGVCFKRAGTGARRRCRDWGGTTRVKFAEDFSAGAGPLLLPLLLQWRRSCTAETRAHRRAGAGPLLLRCRCICTAALGPWSEPVVTV